MRFYIDENLLFFSLLREKGVCNLSFDSNRFFSQAEICEFMRIQCFLLEKIIFRVQGESTSFKNIPLLLQTSLVGEKPTTQYHLCY